MKPARALDKILLLSLLPVMAGAETFTAIAQSGKRKIDLLRRLRPYANGTPDLDRLGAVFAALDPEPFQKCFVALPGQRFDTVGVEPLIKGLSFDALIAVVSSCGSPGACMTSSRLTNALATTFLMSISFGLRVRTGLQSPRRTRAVRIDTGPESFFRIAGGEPVLQPTHRCGMIGTEGLNADAACDSFCP